MLQRFFPFLNWLPLAKKSWKDDLIYGFYTAMITPIIAALFGSSYHLISGPTTAISIVVYATISSFVDPGSDIDQYIALTLVLTFMAGIIQFAMGLARMGRLVNFVSHSVIIGFTAGAGVLIAFKQLKHVFGLDIPQGSSFYNIVKYIINNISETNWYVFTIAIGTLLIAIIIRQFIKPLSRYYMLIAMVLGSFLAIFLGGEANGIETVGKIPSNLPPFRMPELNLTNVKNLSGGALTVALLGLIEAVAIARSIALTSHQRIDSNREFKGQGLSNIIASFFSSYMGSGSFTRSGVNLQAGGKTPMSAIFSASFLMIILLLFSNFAAFLPKPAMGGIILLVGFNLIDFHHIKQVVKSSGREIIVLSTTLFGTLFFELETALFSGIALSLFFYLERTAKPNIAILGSSKTHRFINVVRDSNVKVCPQLKIVRIDGSIYFGALEVVSDFFNNLYEKGEIKHVLVVAKGINFIDLAGATWLTHEAKKWQERGGGIYFSSLTIVSQQILKKGGFRIEIGEENFYKDKRTAIAEIYKKLDKDICKKCEVHVFYEC